MSEESLHTRIDKALRLQFRNLFGKPDKKVYCWRRHLVRLKGFRTISLDLLLANLELFSDHVAVKDPSCGLVGGPAPGNRLIVAHRDFALKCLVGWDTPEVAFKRTSINYPAPKGTGFVI